MLFGTTIISAFSYPAPISINDTALESNHSPITVISEVKEIATTSPKVAYNPIAYNCYLFVQSKVKNLPNQAKIVPNSPMKVGSVAIFDYKDTPHLGLVTAVYSDGDFEVWESNFHHGKIDRRMVNITDSHLLGFWNPVNPVNDI